MKKAHGIKSVIKGSIAEELGLQPGDVLISINGDPVGDILEYKYMINEDYIEVLVQKASGEEWLLEIDKEPYEDLGLEFERGLMDRDRKCTNKCIFCFVDQLPKGMRGSLYFKDDDSRLSFLQGNFISLTNLGAVDIERIIKYKISPLNVSVHTTEPRLRVKMLRNPRAGKALDIMGTFLREGLTLNCQIVLCPGINDGKNLERTLKDLFGLGRGIKSIGVVPVGITKFREGLYPLKPFNAEDALQAIDTVRHWQRSFKTEYGSRVVYAADELYLKARIPFPSSEAYEGFPQLENGIGMMVLFNEQFNRQFRKKHRNIEKHDIVSIATGTAAWDFIMTFGRRIEEGKRNKKVLVYPITNNFFGKTIDVAGLITGCDLISQLKGEELGERLLIPENMLKAGEKIFLDGVSISEVRKNLNVDVEVCPVHGGELFKKIVLGGLK